MERIWGVRSKALILDIIVVTLFLWVISALIYPLIALLGLFSIMNFWIIISAILIILYFTYLEGRSGASLGKKVFHIRVVAIDGEMNYSKAFTRNLSKILWLPLIIDFCLGYVFASTNQRFLDRAAGTVVVREEEIEEVFEDEVDEIIVER